MSRALLADIGGTNARFALVDNGAVGPIDVLAVADHQRAGDAIAHYLARHSSGMRVEAAAIGVAGPVDSGRGVFTNSNWAVDAAELRATFGFDTVRVVNDFVALAWSLPRLTSVDLVQLGGGTARRAAPLLVLGPGTGLGVACLVPGERPEVIATEAGHASLAAVSLRQDAILGWLRDRFGHVSAERVLSGDGLVNLHDAVVAVGGAVIAHHDAPTITGTASRIGCPACREAFELFCAWLGGVAGDLTLTFGAWGGVYIGGGIAPRIVADLARSSFRMQFEAKGRFRDRLAEVPAYVIRRANPAFLGLAALLADDAPNVPTD